VQLRIWKQIYLTPLVRLNLYTRRLSISFGHRRIGWIAFFKRVIREILKTPLGIYLKDNCGKRSKHAAPKEIDHGTRNEEVRKSRLEANFLRLNAT
jgi:hypothetical protein